MPRRTRMIPREHGAWMMLYGPLVVGLLHGAGPIAALSLDAVGLTLLVTGAFCGRVPLSVLVSRRPNERSAARRWTIRFAELIVAGGVLLARNPNLARLLILACAGFAVVVAHMVMATRRGHRSVFGELVGITGLTLTAPLGYFTASGDDWSRALLLWALCALFFGSSVVYVKWRVARLVAARRGDGSRAPSAALISYHVALVLVVFALVVTRAVPLAACGAYAPLAVRYALTLITGPHPTLVQIGVSELVNSLAFVVILSLTL